MVCGFCVVSVTGAETGAGEGLSWVNNTSPCQWVNQTSNWTIGGPLVTNATTGAAGNETTGIQISINVTVSGNETAATSRNATGGAVGGGATWGLSVMQRCQAEGNHWCCNEGRRFGWCEPDSSHYVCLG